MKPSPFKIRSASALMFLSTLLILLFQTGCKKSDTTESKPTPTKFTELQIDPAFQFNNFITLDVTITVANSGSALLSLIQIYDGNPAEGGKTIVSGATDANSQYKSTVRVAARLKELWLGRIAPDGLSEYVSVPITGTSLTYTFGQGPLKSAEGANDCNTGTPITVNGSYTVASGQTYVVQPGYTISNLQLTVNQGGTVRICGTAHITQFNGTGKLIVSQSGYITMPVEHIYGTIENFGSANLAQASNSSNFTIEPGGTFINWGNVTVANGFYIKGTAINNYHITCLEDFQTTDNGTFTNNCQMFVNSTSNEACKITSGSPSKSGLINGANGFIKVTGHTLITGDAYVTLGSQSLIETASFRIQGYVTGPAAQGAQMHAFGSTSLIAEGNLQGYVDFWASTISPKNGTFGPNITWHNPGYTITAQDCSAPTAPAITSLLTYAGTVGIPITPYVVTATGTDPLTFTATNLPNGLTFNPTTRTISGTPTTAQTKNVALTADNPVGTDSKTLVFNVTNPPSPPAIISGLKGLTPVNQPYSYLVEATGSGTITFNATNLPQGLIFSPTTQTISGSPSTAGTYNITLQATSPYGTDNKTLVLTVGNPPVITSALTANATTGQQFVGYTVTATGSGTVSISVSGLPAGLIFSDDYRTINGTPVTAQTAHVTMTASSEFGNDSKILTITIIDPVVAPQITSALSVPAFKSRPFSYQITGLGTKPMTFTATNLPAGLSYNAEFGVISGIPTGSGTFSVPLSAANSAGTDHKTLVISIPVFSGGFTDSDSDGASDAIDAYPNDPTRAFNSYYPNEVDYGTYAFEDYWPAYGDYDFNDLVVNFNYQIVTNAQNKVVDLVAKYKVKAAGAGFNNGFGVSLDVAPSNVASVTGCVKVGSAVNIDPKGFESGHTDKTVFIPFDAVKTLFGKAIVNTVPTGAAVQPEITTITVHLSTPQNSIGAAPFNPFIFINQDRGKEVHLKDHAPTALVNPVYFSTNNDDSKPASSTFYRSTTGLPWAIEVPTDFAYPIEKSDILQSYQYFATWAQSSGADYADWYLNKPGYQNTSKIY